MNSLHILYEDNHLIVVEKLINLLSQSDITEDMDLLSLVKQYIKDKYHKPGNVYVGLVHRLDRPVGGIMVFAKTSKAATRLSEQIRNRQMKKRYLAVVNGVLKSETDQFVDPLQRLSNGNTIVSPEGKEARLNYEVIEVNSSTKHTLVAIDLETGRHHQIRVQFASRGFPLCGDQRYGKQDRTQIALFAYQLSFTHPVTKEELKFELLPPKNGYWTEFTL